VRKLARILLYAGLLYTFAPHSVAQATPPQESTERAKEPFFSGNVVAVTSDKLTVSRRTLALSTVTKVFLMDAQTVVEGKLEPKARVTVKFEKTDDGERAVKVIVRSH
jgi:hypothetical protein